MSESRIERERWQRVSRLLDDALELDAERRADFLRRAVGDDEALGREVDSLLTAVDASEDFLEGPAQPTPKTEPAAQELAPGTLLGAWRVERLLGRGGMGEVYLAERADGRYEQRAAIKLLQPEAGELRPRFEEECRLLARLEHPGIARLYDAGVAPDGRPYMVMEYVVGQPLAAWARARRLDLAARLSLFLEICSAVAYAHANLVVHRDLKPANILVTADGRIKLLDFGVGKLLEADGTSETTLSAAGLTPEYAAPEQLAGQAVTTATDIYALGVLLYELLTGHRPWAGESVARVLHALLHEEPPPPSTGVPQRESTRPDPVHDERSDGIDGDAPPVPPRLLRGDLDAIVAKCLRKEPQHRYGTVNGLALDVRRHLDGEPVAARANARLYVLGRLLRRHRLAVASALALVLTLGAGLAGTLWQASVARQQAEQARRESLRAGATRDFLAELFTAVDPDVARGQVPDALDLLDEGARRVRRGAFGKAPELRGEMLGLLGDLYRKIGRYGAGRPLLVEALRLAKSTGDPGVRAVALLRLGTLEKDAGRHERARDVLERAAALLAEAGRVPGERHSLVMHQLAVTLVEMGRAREATERTREALRRARAAPDLPPRALYHYLFSRSVALLEIGRNRRAEPLLREALALDVSGSDAPSSRLVMHTQLAYVRETEGDHEAAVAHRRAALALAERIYPPIHRQRAQTLNDLANSILWLGELDEAEAALREALRILEVLYPDGRHVGVTAVNNNLGHTLSDAGRYEEAEPYLRRARELTGELFGRDHRRYGTASANLAALLGRMGRYDEAEAMLHEALRVRRAVLGPRHPLIGLTLGQLASVRLSQKRPAEALELADETLALYRETGHEDPAYLLAALGFRARALAQLGRDKEAEVTFAEAVALGERAGDDARREWAKFLMWYAEFLVDRGVESAPVVVDQALHLYRETFGDDHPTTRYLTGLARGEAPATAESGL